MRHEQIHCEKTGRKSRVNVRRGVAAVVAAGLLGVSGCKPPTGGEPSPEAPRQVFHPAKLQEMDGAINKAIEARQLPGGVLWVERHGEIYKNVYGQRALVPAGEPMTAETIFDAASLTKVVATTPAILLLHERGKLSLDAPVHTYIPDFKANSKEAVTVRHLLTHTSGLRPGIPGTPDWSGYDKGIELACAEKLVTPPGTVFRYSDINFILLGEIVRRVSGQGLDQFTAKEIYEPLKMVDSGFLPAEASRDRIAPTEKSGGAILRGVVHDPTARRMGGVAGHAGLFTTAADLARYGRMMLSGGELEGVRLLKPETVQLATAVQTPDEVSSRRGLGWDIDSGYASLRGSVFPIGSYGHTGWTGTSLWIDPFSETFWIFLSNRNHPDGKGNVIGLRKTLGTLAAEAIVGFNFAYVPGALPAQKEEPSADKPAADSKVTPGKTLNGIDVLVRSRFAALRGLKVGLITNHTGADRERRTTIDLLHEAPEVELKALFSPEHGIRGELDSKISDSVDEKTGLPVYSLYGQIRKPTPEQLKGLDALVFDIQDIGCRFYTYISTMGLAMQAAGEAGIKFYVLDRVNPINGVATDGPILNDDTSFVGFHPIPLRHGMTVGELAKMFNAERRYGADLTVIGVENWSRSMWYDETGLPWANPSPNMRSLKQAILYPGVGLLESTVSVGRGTDTPFEVVGAPYVDDMKFAAELNAAGLSGVRFVPIRFTPTASIHKGKTCGGVYIMLTDRDRCDVVNIGLVMAQTLHRLYPDSVDLEKMHRLLLHRRSLDSLKTDLPIKDIRSAWGIDLAEFEKRRAKFLIYN